MNQSEITPPNNQAPQPFYYQIPPAEDEIDLFELFASLFTQWRLITLITVFGALLSVVIALLIPKTYDTSASVRIPTSAQIAAINENGLSKYTTGDLFKRYFDEVKARENLKNYLVKSNPFPKMDPNFNNEDLEQAAASLANAIDITIVEPELPKGEVAKFPELFEISLSTSTEPVAVTILNGYLQHIEEAVIEDIRDEGSVEIGLRKGSIEREVALLRSSEKRSRESLIDKLVEQNRGKIIKLEQQIDLLRTDAASNRQSQIDRMVEANQKQIDVLQQKIAMLRTDAASNRQSQIDRMVEANQKQIDVLQQKIALLRTEAREKRLQLIKKLKEGNNTKIAALRQKIALLKEQKQSEIASQVVSLQEALRLAKTSGIKKPTTLDQLAIANAPQSTAAQTQVNVSNTQNSMQFLLGTDYLSTQIELLKGREDVTPFVPQIREIEAEIITLQNDTTIAALESRASDDPYIDGLQDLITQIKAIEDDKAIAALKNRKTDDPYITELQAIFSQITALENDKAIAALKNRKTDDPYITELQAIFSQITALENDKTIAALKIRESDDPFIEALPAKYGALEKLDNINFEFGDAALYRVDKAAFVDGIAEKPNRKLIAVLGTLLSGMMALFIALIVVTAKKRALRQAG